MVVLFLCLTVSKKVSGHHFVPCFVAERAVVNEFSDFALRGQYS